MRLLLLLACIVSLAGCAAQPPTPLPAPAEEGIPPSATCGSVDVYAHNDEGRAAAQHTQGCFWQAYQHCSPTMQSGFIIRITSHSNHFVYYVVTLEHPEGNCAIRLFRAEGNHGGVGNHVDTETCSAMTQGTDGVLHMTGCVRFGSSSGTGTFDVPQP